MPLLTGQRPTGAGQATDMNRLPNQFPLPGMRAPISQSIRQNHMSLGRGQPNFGQTKPLLNTQGAAPIAANAAPSLADSQATEYNDLMGKYNAAMSSVGGRPPAAMAPQPMIPERQQYQEDPRHTSAITNMEELSRTGGYSEQDKSDLRARGLSPIRAAYQNAQRNMSRQRANSGGYSPNFNAAASRMAREQGQLLGDQISNVNAGIAQNVAQNRVGLASQLTGATGHVTDAKNQIGAGNMAAGNRAQEFNAGNQLNYDQLNNQVTQNRDATMSGLLNGAGNLYGTTPARAATFGNQALQGQGQQIQQGQALIDAWLRANQGGR